MAQKTVTSFPRIVRVPDPLGLYLRLGHNDHKVLLDLLASGNKSFFGVVFDPTKHNRHSELREKILESNLDAILDPKTLRSSLPGSYTSAMGDLPWGRKRLHICEDFEGILGRKLVGDIASFACDNGFTQVMAPTHYISSIDDPWLKTDIDSTYLLRNFLDQKGGSKTPIIYPLTIPYSIFRNANQRQLIIEEICQLPIASIWLMVDGAGRDSTAAGARNYINAARDFHSMGIPIVADHMGGVIGLSLLAFGAVGGIAHGIMQNEQLSAASWKRQRNNNSNFGKPRRVYVPVIDAMLSEKEAELLFNSRRAKANFACNDSKCCPRDIKDMVENNARHFLYQRMQEVGGLSQIPETIRPKRFIERYLRPTTDKAVAATQVDWGDGKIEKKMQKNRKRLDTLRVVLSDCAEKQPSLSFSQHPQMRVSRSAN